MDFKDQLKKLDFKKAKIEFINHIPQQELVSHLQSASIFVLFSNYENLPCVILEAFSCGVSVIATKVGGIQEFFPNTVFIHDHVLLDQAYGCFLAREFLEVGITI